MYLLKHKRDRNTSQINQSQVKFAITNQTNNQKSVVGVQCMTYL